MSCHWTNVLDSHQKELCHLILKHTRADEIIKKIIQECEDFLSVKRHKELINQENAEKKIFFLFKTVIENGEQTCREFIQILEKIEQLQQFWSKNKQESSRQTVYADNSFVDNRRIAGGKSKGLSMQVEIPAYQHVANSQHDTGVRHIPLNTDIVAISSTVLNNEIVDHDIDGNIDLSVRIPRGLSGPYVAMEKGCVASSPGSSVDKEKGSIASSSVKDKLGFFLKNRSDLVDKVKNVLPIVDYLQTNRYHSEMAANVKAKETEQLQMRLLLDSTTSTGAAEALFTALCKHEEELMKDLIGS